MLNLHSLSWRLLECATSSFKSVRACTLCMLSMLNNPSAHPAILHAARSSAPPCWPISLPKSLPIESKSNRKCPWLSSAGVFCCHSRLGGTGNVLLHLKLSDSATSLHIPQSSITDVCNLFRLNLQKVSWRLLECATSLFKSVMVYIPCMPSMLNNPSAHPAILHAVRPCAPAAGLPHCRRACPSKASQTIHACCTKVRLSFAAHSVLEALGMCYFT